MAKIYFKEIPSFITKISNHIGYQVQIFQVKDMYNGDYECFSSEEDKVKSYLDCYIFLLNNVPNVICKSIVEKVIFIMSQKRVNKSKLEEVISEFISIKEERNIKKIINISFNLSSLIRNNKDKYIFRLMIMNYLLLHYQAAGALALTLFEFGIFLIDHIQSALAPYNLAVGRTLLYGGSYFHILCLVFLFVSECYTSLRKVVRRHFHPDFVAGENLDIVHTHLAGDVGRDLMAILKFDLEHCVGQGFENHSVLLYCSLFRHVPIFCLICFPIGLLL